MSMLAEQRRKQKYSVDPRGLNWSKDESKFGHRMLEKMGWQKGKGLGAKEDGNTEHVKVSLKTDSTGVGCSKSHADNWVAHQDDFNALLSTLNADHAGQGSDTEKVQSLEETSKTTKGRVLYGKFARGKDLSSYKSNDLDSIFGKRKSKSEPNTPQNLSEPNTPQNLSEDDSDVESTESNPERGTTNMENKDSRFKTSTTSLQDYFAKKMADMKGAHPNSRYNQFPANNQTGQSGAESDNEDVHTTQGFGFSAVGNSLSEENIETKAEKEGNSDNACKKKKKSKRKYEKDNSDKEDSERPDESVKSKSKKKHKSDKKKSRKNQDEMERQVSDAETQSDMKMDQEKTKKKHKKDKKKSRKDESEQLLEESKSYEDPAGEEKLKKKSKKHKKKSHKDESNVDEGMAESSETSKDKDSGDDQVKKSKKRKRKDQDDLSVNEDTPVANVPKKKKKVKQEDVAPSPDPTAEEKDTDRSSKKSDETEGENRDLEKLDKKNEDVGVRDQLAAAFPGSNVDNIQGYAGGVSLRTTKFKNKKNTPRKNNTPLQQN